MNDLNIKIVSIAERPDLAQIAARLKWNAFSYFKQHGYKLPDVEKLLASETFEIVPPQKPSFSW